MKHVRFLVSFNIILEGNVCCCYGSVFVYDRQAKARNLPDLFLANDELSAMYHRSFSDENIDIDLLMTILHEVHRYQDGGKSM